ncbi:MAG: hypothetical protein ABSA72_02070 [Nitrososphaerales archaeon]|jgi:archaellum component FlaG (FlaF/FlaG flagellin family)
MMRPPLVRSSSAITEGFFVVAAVIAVSLVASSVIPGITLVSNAYARQAVQDKNKVDVQLTVIFAYGTPGSTTADVWIKNTGLVSLSAPAINQSTVFFGPTGDYQMLPDGGGYPPSWTFSIVNGNTTLNPGQTMEVAIRTATPLSSGGYYFQITTYVGTSFDYTFSM